MSALTTDQISAQHRLTTQTNHLPKLLCAETTVTRTDKTPIKSDALLNQSSNQLTRSKYSKCRTSSPSLAQIQARLSLQSLAWSRSVHSHQIWTDLLLLLLPLFSLVVLCVFCSSFYKSDGQHLVKMRVGFPCLPLPLKEQSQPLIQASHQWCTSTWACGLSSWVCWALHHPHVEG